MKGNTSDVEAQSSVSLCNVSYWSIFQFSLQGKCLVIFFVVSKIYFALNGDGLEHQFYSKMGYSSMMKNLFYDVYFVGNINHVKISIEINARVSMGMLKYCIGMVIYQ